jgi:hypothetical protein
MNFMNMRIFNASNYLHEKNMVPLSFPLLSVIFLCAMQSCIFVNTSVSAGLAVMHAAFVNIIVNNLI